jgi:hypothetical protein
MKDIAYCIEIAKTSNLSIYMSLLFRALSDGHNHLLICVYYIVGHLRNDTGCLLYDDQATLSIYDNLLRHLMMDIHVIFQLCSATDVHKMKGTESVHKHVCRKAYF